jgi:hypothetical protein
MAARDAPSRDLDVVASGDRHELEALQLEIRQLARTWGVEVVRVEIAPARRRVSGTRRARRRRG